MSLLGIPKEEIKEFDEFVRVIIGAWEIYKGTARRNYMEKNISREFFVDEKKRGKKK